MDFFEEQTAGWSGRAGCGAIPGIENGGQFFPLSSSLAYSNQGAGKDADHLAEKTIPGDANRPVVSAAQHGKTAGLDERTDCATAMGGIFIA